MHLFERIYHFLSFLQILRKLNKALVSYSPKSIELRTFFLCSNTILDKIVDTLFIPYGKIAPSPPAQSWNLKFCTSAPNTIQHWLVGKGEEWGVGKGLKLDTPKKPEFHSFKNCRIMHLKKSELSQFVSTNFVQDCVREVQKKSSKFRFLAITWKVIQILKPNLAHM